MIRRVIPILIFSIFMIWLYINKDRMFTLPVFGNLHTHTTCSDGKNSYEEMIQSALKLKFNFIAITDHIICKDVIALCEKETRIYCIPGQEVTGERTHLVSLFTTKYINPDQPLIRQVEEIHKLGGLAIAAHPNIKEKFTYTDDELTNSGFDAMECTKDAGERRPLPCVYDSDAHNAEDLRWQFMSCKTNIRSKDDVKTAIFSGRCSRSSHLK